MRAIPFELKADLAWKVYRTPETGQWIGVCDPMGVSLLGDSFLELQEIIAESLDALFRDLLKSGELEQFLGERGWSLKSTPDPKALDYPGSRLDVPWSMMPIPAYDIPAQACH